MDQNEAEILNRLRETVSDQWKEQMEPVQQKMDGLKPQTIDMERRFQKHETGKSVTS